MRFSRAGIIKFIFISLLAIGEIGFVISLPNIIVNWLIEKTKPEYDEEGNLIYDDGRHTVASFGKRKEFAVWKSRANGQLELFL